MMTITYQLFDDTVERQAYTSEEEFWSDLKFFVSVGAYIE